MTKLLKSVIFSLFVIFTASAWAQDATFTGVVTDNSGAAIAKAQVTVSNSATGVALTTTTTRSGDYTIPYLAPGVYSLAAEAAGFKREQKIDITLEVSKRAVINFKLQVGAATETITVTDQALIDFGKADQGETIEHTRVTELPLNGGDPGMLAILSAGAGWTGAPQYQRPFDDTQQNLSVNGGAPGNVALMLDGVSNIASPLNNNGQAKIAYVAPVDSVQEFKIITNPYDAQYGLYAGAVEDVVLKSGTNTLHGDVYEHARRTWLDANTWQDKYTLATLPPGSDTSPYSTPHMKWDQYGAELNGPVILPKIYDGRNHSFFTLQYENFKETEPNTQYQSVPGKGWANGDFSNLVYWNGTDKQYEPISLLDPQNIHQNPDGSYTRVPFGPTDGVSPSSAANIIPASRINPVAQKILSYYPQPNRTPPAGSNPFALNFVAQAPDLNRYRNALAKWDQVLRDKDRFSLHYGYWERVQTSSNGLGTAAEEGSLPYGERSHTFTLEETHTFRPNLLFDFRSNVSVRADYNYNGPRFDPTALGWSQSQIDSYGPAATREFPFFSISEFASLGTNSNQQTVKNSLVLLPSVTWIKGKHVIHAGLDARFWQTSSAIPAGANFYVDRQWTQTNCCGSWDPASGNSIASLLLGNPTSGGVTIATNTFYSAHYWAPFFQDDWKVTNRITLNLGLRWDFLPSQTERHNQGDSGFDTTTVNPINSQVKVPGYSQIVGGITFLGVNGQPRGLYPLQLSDIQPRAGMTFAVDPHTVFRMGFGRSMRIPQFGADPLGFSANTSYQPYDNTHPANVYPNLANQISNPFPFIVQPQGSKLGLLTNLGQGYYEIDPQYKIPAFWNYSVGIEHEFSKHDLINVAYVGSQLWGDDCQAATFNGLCSNINHQDPNAWAKCNPETGGRYETCNNNNVTNPFLGVSAFQGSNYYSASTINALNLTRPFPQFQDITMYNANAGHTWYNSLQVTAEHKFDKALTLHATWTWSKEMTEGGVKDTTYLVPFRQIDTFDRTHRVTVSGVYMLPVGRGRTFLSNSNRIVDGVLGGWEVGSLYIFQTGMPWLQPGGLITLHNARVQPHLQKDNGFIRLVAACAEYYTENSSGAYQLTPLTGYDYDGNCSSGPNFRVVPGFAPQSNNVYEGIRNPSAQQFDANLSKNFKLWENLGLQIRVEAFNVFNHPSWDEAPNGNVFDPDFGLIKRGEVGTSNLARQMQLSAKVSW